MPSRQSVVRKQYLKTMRTTGAIMCGICDFPIVRESDLTVDHILPKAHNGSNRVANFQPAHHVCNQIKAADKDFKLTTEIKREPNTI